MVDRIAAETEAVFDKIMPSPHWLTTWRMLSRSGPTRASSLRLLRALGDIAASTPDPEFRRILVEHGMRIVAGCAEKLGGERTERVTRSPGRAGEIHRDLAAVDYGSRVG